MHPDSWDDNKSDTEWCSEKVKFIQRNRRNEIARKERRSRLHRNRFDGPGVRHERIKGYDSRLCMFSFYQMDRANINKCSGNPSKENESSTESLEETMAWTYYFASTFESVIDIIFRERPRKPPDDRFITATAMLLLPVACISTLVFMSGCRLARHKEKKTKRKRRKRSTRAIDRRTSMKRHRKLVQLLDTKSGRRFAADFDSSLQLLVSEGVTDKDGDVFFPSHSNLQSAIEDEFHECQGSLASEGDPYPGLEIGRFLNGFTTSLADVDLECMNTQISFDSDSTFFVCDNSTTGHICNDVKKFVPGTLHQTG